MTMNSVICIASPFIEGSKGKRSHTIEAVRSSGLLHDLHAGWADVHPDYAHYYDPVEAVNMAIAHTIQEHPGSFPLILMGDTASTLGVIRGIPQKHVNVIWYDTDEPDALMGMVGSMLSSVKLMHDLRQVSSLDKHCLYLHINLNVLQDQSLADVVKAVKTVAHQYRNCLAAASITVANATPDEVKVVAEALIP
jgi:hypothetical protein